MQRTADNGHRRHVTVQGTSQSTYLVCVNPRKNPRLDVREALGQRRDLQVLLV